MGLDRDLPIKVDTDSHFYKVIPHFLVSETGSLSIIYVTTSMLVFVPENTIFHPVLFVSFYNIPHVRKKNRGYFNRSGLRN